MNGVGEPRQLKPGIVISGSKLAECENMGYSAMYICVQWPALLEGYGRSQPVVKTTVLKAARSTTALAQQPIADSAAAIN